MRPAIGTNCRLFFLSSIALVLFALLSPLGALRTHDVRVTRNALSGDYARAGNGLALVPMPAAPGGASIHADGSKFIEENKDESSCSPSHLVSLTSIAADCPPKILSGPLPGSSPSRPLATPLRC